MSNERPGMFTRMRSLLRGVFGSWVREKEQEKQEVVYEQAIAERVRQYRELKDAVAGILYMRNKLESEIAERRAEIARLHDDVRRAVRRDDETTSLSLIAQSRPSSRSSSAPSRSWKRSGSRLRRPRTT